MIQQGPFYVLRFIHIHVALMGFLFHFSLWCFNGLAMVWSEQPFVLGIHHVYCHYVFVSQPCPLLWLLSEVHLLIQTPQTITAGIQNMVFCKRVNTTWHKCSIKRMHLYGNQVWGSAQKKKHTPKCYILPKESICALFFCGLFYFQHALCAG